MKVKSPLVISCLISLPYFPLNAEPIVIQQTLTPELCQQIIMNTENTNNSAYEPGIDIEGHSVTPADLSSSIKIELPQKITIPLHLNVQKFLNIPNNATNALREYTDLGILTLHQDGRLYYGDQPLFDEDQAAVIKACQTILLKDSSASKK